MTKPQMPALTELAETITRVTGVPTAVSHGQVPNRPTMAMFWAEIPMTGISAQIPTELAEDPAVAEVYGPIMFAEPTRHAARQLIKLAAALNTLADTWDPPRTPPFQDLGRRFTVHRDG